MACGQRIYVYAVLMGTICLHSFTSYGKGEKDAGADNSSTVTSKEKFQWPEHSRLSWDDFKGPANAGNDPSAAVTYCGIGIKTNIATADGKAEIEVYNTFNTKKSWVREDAKIQSILVHEQGHFDLCEIYTRKLRNRLKKFDMNVAHARQLLMGIYTEVNKEYESRQQAYEQETIHGTNLTEQKKWLDMISYELDGPGI